jgi:glycosyltransferase involved in cell wall biosynthesis
MRCLRKFLRMLFRFFRFWRHEHHHKERPKISLLIPFTTKNAERKAEFEWLLKYWEHELPNAEIIVGTSHSRIFNKNEALNQAVRKATGRVLVTLDADAYMPGRIIERCADRILEEMDNHLWYVPYRHLYRLKRKISMEIIASDPENPLRLLSPPPLEDVENGQQSSYGHRYAAMAMVFPREAFDAVGGCFDERFGKGWGGEDIALLRALDTLYGKHKTINTDILHLWHPVLGDSYKTRIWKGQTNSQVNSNLANAYNRATRKPEQMRKLVEEGCKSKKHSYPRFDKD